MATYNLLLLPGDGIGPEVMAEVKRLIEFFNKKGPDKFATRRRWSAAAPMTRTGSRSPKRRWRRRRPPTP